MAETYTEAVLDPFRGRAVKVFLLIQVILVVAGYLVAQLGQTNTTLGAHPDVHRALGAVFAALAIAFTATFLVIYIISVVMSIRHQTTVRTDF